MACNCEGGFINLSTTDLKCLLVIMRDKKDDQAQGLRLAIRKELADRGVK